MKVFTKDLYAELGLKKYFWGGIKKISLDSIDLTDTESIISILDSSSANENLSMLGSDWIEIDFNRYKFLCISAFCFSLGFPKKEIMTFEIAQSVFDKIIDEDMFKNCRCYTNCSESPWDGENSAFAFNSISTYAMDLAMVVLNNESLVFTYILYED